MRRLRGAWRAFWRTLGGDVWTCRACGAIIERRVVGCDDRLADWEAELLHEGAHREKWGP